MAGSVFISFEGGEGSGKTTQASILRDSLVKVGFTAVLVREPGSTPFGDYLRRYLKGDHRLSPKAELLLFAAARVQLVTEVIAPTLKRGISVVADRYADSTLAYQGYGRTLDLDTVRSLNSFATEGLKPHLTFLLDIEPAEGHGRIYPSGSPRGSRPSQVSLKLEMGNGEPLGRLEEEGQQRFEELPLEFHQRVRRGYLSLAKQEPERWVVLDATLSQEELAAQIWQRVSDLLKDA